MGLLTMIAVLLGSVAFFVVLTTVSLLITQPLESSMVRLRANYLPRAVSLGFADETAPGSRGLFGIRSEPVKVGPVTSGVFGMARRVVSIEGWTGLYRGAFPVMLQMLWITTLGSALIAPFVSSDSKWKKAVATGEIGVFPMLVSILIVIVVDLPMTIVSYRTIVHPHALPVTKPLSNLRELLSPGELRRPWRLYTLPGMASVCIAQVLLSGLAMPVARKLSFGSRSGVTSFSDLPADNPSTSPTGPSASVSAFSIAAFLVFNVIIFAVSVPLQCAAIRLSTQRPSEAPSAADVRASINPASHQASVSTADAPLDEGEEDTPLGAWQAHAGSRLPSEPSENPEPVVILRPCAASAIEADAGNGTVRPYAGLWDCLHTMVQEEGIESIYRGWGVSVFMMSLAFVATLF